jgi:hypothetical protein
VNWKPNFCLSKGSGGAYWLQALARKWLAAFHPFIKQMEPKQTLIR